MCQILYRYIIPGHKDGVISQVKCSTKKPLKKEVWQCFIVASLTMNIKSQLYAQQFPALLTSMLDNSFYFSFYFCELLSVDTG